MSHRRSDCFHFLPIAQNSAAVFVDFAEKSSGGCSSCFCILYRIPGCKKDATGHFFFSVFMSSRSFPAHGAGDGAAVRLTGRGTCASCQDYYTKQHRRDEEKFSVPAKFYHGARKRPAGFVRCDEKQKYSRPIFSLFPRRFSQAVPRRLVSA